MKQAWLISFGFVFPAIGTASFAQELLPALFGENPLGNRLPRSAIRFNTAVDTAIGDLDNDGDLDVIAVANGYQVWINEGEGNFTEKLQPDIARFSNGKRVFLHDLDGDSDLDAFVALSHSPNNTLIEPVNQVWINQGGAQSGELAHFIVRPNVAVTQAALEERYAWGDLDGDGFPEFLATDSLAKTTAVWSADAGGNFSRSHLNVPHRLSPGNALGDFDGDGDLDVMIQVSSLINGNDGYLQVLENDGGNQLIDGARVPGSDWQADNTPRYLITDDLNADGFDDLVYLRTDVNPLEPSVVSCYILWNTGLGDGTFEEPVRLGVDYHHIVAVAIGDMNGDGLPDLAVGRNGSTTAEKKTHIWLNQGSHAFVRTADNPTTFHGMVRVADFDGNGTLDLFNLTATHPNKTTTQQIETEFPAGATPVYDFTSWIPGPNAFRFTLRLTLAPEEPIEVTVKISGGGIIREQIVEIDDTERFTVLLKNPSLDGARNYDVSIATTPEIEIVGNDRFSLTGVWPDRVFEKRDDDTLCIAQVVKTRRTLISKSSVALPSGAIVRPEADPIVAAQEEDFLTPLRLFRDAHLLASPQGRYYTQIYYSSGPEISAMALKDFILAYRLLDAFLEWSPTISSFVDGETAMTISPQMIKAARLVVNEIKASATPQLLTLIESEEAVLDLESFIGLTFNQALDRMNTRKLPPNFEYIDIKHTEKGAQITWQAAPGHHYRVERSDDLKAFDTVGDLIKGDGDLVSFVLETRAKLEAFFRVVVDSFAGDDGEEDMEPAPNPVE